MKRLNQTPVAMLLIFALSNSGCFISASSDTAGRSTYLWMPYMGCWKIDEDPRARPPRKKSAELDKAQPTGNELEKKVVPLTATVTDTR